MSFLTNIVIFSFFIFANSSKVPLLLWTNIEGFSCQRSNQRLTESVSSYFTDKYMNCLSKYHPDHIVLFVYDKLGIEEITLYGQFGTKDNAFNNIHTMMKHDGSLTLPEVEPSSVVEDLFQKFNKAANGTKIKIVRLPPIDRSDVESTVNGLQQDDMEIKNVLKSTKGKYIAIVTSENTLDNIAPRHVREAVGRQLLATNDDKKNETVWEPVFLASPCVYMSFLSVNLTVNQKLPKKNTYKSVLLLHNNHTGIINITDYTCLANDNETAGNVSVTLDFRGNNSYFQNVSMTMLFNKNESAGVDGSRWWKLYRFTLNIQANATATNGVDLKPNLDLNYRLFQDVMTAPDNMSWACAQTSGLSDLTAKTVNATVYVQFTNFQVQPFGINTTSRNFTAAADCSGWYTGPIWSGLIVTLLLLAILSYGLAMISNVTTMDRFDDPKGKGISVPQEAT